MDKLNADIKNDFLVVSDRESGRGRRVVTMLEGESMAQQQFKAQCDVNKIMAKFKKTGSVTHLRNRAEGVYADLVDAPDYRQAMDTVVKANEAFAALPAATRQRFGNDPHAMISFLANPENVKEAVKLGLMEVHATKESDPVVEEIAALRKDLSSKA